MERNVNLAGKKIFHLETSMIIYGVYNAETEKLVQTINRLHNKTTWNENYLQLYLQDGLICIYQNKDHYTMP